MTRIVRFQSPPRRRRSAPAPGDWNTVIRGALVAPALYSLAVPIALLDVWVSLYQLLVFPILGIERVSRKPYVTGDRHALPYLNAVEKLNCLYCGYATGVIAYTRDVAARTEQYWCPIKHHRAGPKPHDRYDAFAAYGDERAFRRLAEELRLALRPSGRTAQRPRGATTDRG